MNNERQTTINNLPVYILLAYTLLNIISFWSAQRRELINNFEDDSYYYFKIAKNVVEHNQFTFDGHTLTNGFHPLWMFFVLFLSYIIRDPFIFLRTLGILSTLVMSAITYVGFMYIRSRYSLTSYSIAATLILSCVIAFGSTGMETTILIPLLILSLLLLIKISPWNTLLSDNTPDKDWLLLGITLSLVQLARLDAILYNVTVLVFILFSDQSSRKWRHFTIVSVPILITGSIYLAVNYSVFQYLMPTSGLMKSMKGGLINTLFIKQLLNPANPDGTLWNIYLGMVIISIGYVIYFSISIPQMRKKISLYYDNCPALVVSLFFLLYTCYQLFGSSWILWRWYGYPIYLVSIFVVPIVIEKIFDRLRFSSNINILVRNINNIITTLILTLMVIVGIRWGYWRKPVITLFANENYLIAEELNSQFQESVIFAMGDRAGSFAYFFNGEVLQLEGLVGDHSIIQAIKDNTLMEYMKKAGVQYVISHVAPPENYTEWTLSTPLPNLSSGPYAEIRLCKESEFLRRETEFYQIYVWRWPSCNQ